MAGHQHHAADAGRGRGAARLADALDREAGRFGARAMRFELLRRSAVRGRSGRDREIAAPAASRRRGRQTCPPARRAPSPPRARPARRRRRRSCRWSRPPPAACRRARAGRGRRPRRARDSSTAPSRTSTDSDIERTATASAASAPAARAALTSRSARSVSALWSSKGVDRGQALLSSQMGAGARGSMAGSRQFAARRQHLVNHGSQRGVNHVRASYGRLTA